MQNFRKLKVWEKSHRLALKIYRVTKQFPKEELYGLTSQIRRSCSSIPINIAEGCGRGRDTEFAQFLQIAMGSASELEYPMLLVHELGYLNSSEFQDFSAGIIEVKQMLSSFIQKLRADS